jgi:serine acetyltransferase
LTLSIFNYFGVKRQYEGNGVVIGAGTIVRKSIPSNCLAAGNPMKIKKQTIPGNYDYLIW